MWLKNKTQGTVWDITDPATLKRKLADPNYEEVPAYEEAKPKQKKGKDKEPDKEPSGL
jgi:hypothetical protein